MAFFLAFLTERSRSLEGWFINFMPQSFLPQYVLSPHIYSKGSWLKYNPLVYVPFYHIFGIYLSQTSLFLLDIPWQDHSVNCHRLNNKEILIHLGIHKVHFVGGACHIYQTTFGFYQWFAVSFFLGRPDLFLTFL